jgi:DNA-binding response OmpR family regulator
MTGVARILVIEDDAPLRANLIDLLEAEDFIAIKAGTGERGFELAVEHLPELILCDVTMRDLDGFSVCRRLRERPDTASIPFIFLSARVEQIDIDRGLCLGATYLTKPFGRRDVLSAIAATLERTTRAQ